MPSQRVPSLSFALSDGSAAAGYRLAAASSGLLGTTSATFNITN